MQHSIRFDFKRLQTCEGLQELTHQFNTYVEENHPQIAERLEAYRAADNVFSKLEESKVILETAPLLDSFVAHLFGVHHEVKDLAEEIQRETRIDWFKKNVIQKRVRRYRQPIDFKFEDLDHWLDETLSKHLIDTTDREYAVASLAQSLHTSNSEDESFEKLLQWCVLADKHDDACTSWVSFKSPKRIDHAHLVSLEQIKGDTIERRQGKSNAFRQRSDFSLTDHRMSQREVLNEINYCVFCHDHDGDFCSIGFPEKKKQPGLGLKKNPLGVTLTGCPLEEKISEMHVLKRDGHTIAALAVAMIDNPMIPATGHRICNDCMKACVYQKKDPVDIPQTETRILTDVLNLSYGVEIYDLLCRWNPLRKQQQMMKPYRGRNVLVVGMGPAGFTIAHHLTMEGCAVVGIDGLKIEPLPEELINQPIRDFSSICENLDDRILGGFGGVAEYGITVRWDKNFLKLIYLTLARRSLFRVHGGVRFGGTVTLADAERLGFDHVCIATGAGLPRVIGMGNSLARGMRQASDFLMALQLTGAAKDDSLANLQIRMPAVVIGGGLTAVDTATEVQVYYLKQIRKIHHRYQTLIDHFGEEHVTGGLDEESREILKEYLNHAEQLHDEESAAKRESRQPDYVGLMRRWGGVTIVYRKGINESPAYQRNHEELIKALEEGIYYAEGLNPVRLELDEFKHVKSLICCRMHQEDGRWLRTSEQVFVPARAVLVAAGTLPNTIYENEHPGTFMMDGSHFLPHVDHDHELQPVQVAEHSKAARFGPFTSYQREGFRVSFLGDTHPVFNGSVVKAIASAARSYPEIIGSFHEAIKPVDELSKINPDDFLSKMDDQLATTVLSVNDSHPVVLEMWVRSPLAAHNFHAGQFFRMQTFESKSKIVENTRLQIPLQTVSGAGVRGDVIRLMLLKWGANARLASMLNEGDPLVLMGPTGAPMDVGEGKTFLIVSGTWGAAVMLGLGPVLRAAGNRVIYVASYTDQSQLYSKQELEAATDAIIWAVGTGERIKPARPQDCSVVTGNMIQLLKDYASGDVSPDNRLLKAPLDEVDEVLVMGSTGLLKGMQAAFREGLAQLFRADVKINGTVGSPMQCMMKGVCGQCLQWQIDPDSGERTRAVFSCAMQDQPLMWIDLDNLAARQGQTRLQEQLTTLWVNHVLSKVEKPVVTELN
ncbi:MAG: pyridine nucleotide-disulfide oxidoreductase [marine bacterium B5-7]|nr:MAG: pyridine nucleotide-disulfide oxidoreductase [marine bacterium B5-7]